MGRFDRRTFLKGGTAAVAAVGALSALPTVAPAVLGAVSGGAEEAGPTLAEELPAVGEPLVARITDAASGEIELYFGETGITTRDPELVGRLLRAAAR
ncbi:twin-arginine translocation signal domain-containing protein [Aciditerrimonas ferrireducens]|jgi:hypothetical protein|uniref:Twin-arginine translocation signal domain-containing protein n=1 Tax=Aciditerrimonas ferrireducens TaxID=667306 RepID=A0ABV6C1N8_9ACTN|nr:twin-arginine translocation signal domain-containing protein [Aciditerrimonas ferrireducens]MCK4178195.1 hypothetical protein [Aciditerrimonas ferrireducens]